MSVAGAITGLGDVLLADAGLTAWARDVSAHGLHRVDGNRPVENIGQQNLPALVLELGAGTSEEQVHGHEMAAVQELAGAIVWQEQDEATAFAQRMALPPLLARAVMANRRLNNAVDGAWLNDWEADRGANHPLNIFRFTVVAEFAIDAQGG